ncbi:hydroxymethylbilane synthase [Xanthovirga aplysinae]|uniref:hydroxymethylbilane synthase n=1 Tax=Xanthovirga aplysinae TaxID=2529853 RepID=UPI0012BD39E7|nr:hydroxymethylbilane synthase [Xanthovirga aplysinae]MTI30915.1 hydroxymethylbilane synthase [Xanthovirga aplysinae]
MIKIGTRGSKLALWQAHYVADKLKKGGIDSEIVIIETKGDKILDVSIHKIGSKGVFTEEIEEQLAAGKIDIAVHSAKDLQSELPKGFELIAFTEREEVNDVLVGKDKSISLNSKKEFVLGTSSTRRIAMLKHFYPHIKTTPVRGNLQTRIKKMEEGECDALLLAFAGVHRMHYDDLILEKFPLDKSTPAVGQGSVAIEVATSLPQAKKDILRKHLNHTETEYRLLAERAFLKKLQGGCSVPVFALATLKNQDLSITGGVLSLDGKEMLKENLKGSVDKAEELGDQLAGIILKKGGDRMLEEIRRQQNNDIAKSGFDI